MQREAHVAFGVLGQRAGAREPLERQLGDGEIDLDGALRRGGEVRVIAQGAGEIERRLPGHADRRLARERNRPVQRRPARVKHHAGSHVDVPYARGRQAARGDGERRARRRERSAGEQPRVELALRLLLLHGVEVQASRKL